MKKNNLEELLEFVAKYKELIEKINELTVEEVNLLYSVINKKFVSVELLKIDKIKYGGKALKLCDGRIIDMFFQKDSYSEKFNYSVLEYVNDNLEEGDLIFLNEKNRTLSKLINLDDLEYDNS